MDQHAAGNAAPILRRAVQRVHLVAAFLLLPGQIERPGRVPLRVERPREPASEVCRVLELAVALQPSPPLLGTEVSDALETRALARVLSLRDTVPEPSMNDRTLCQSVLARSVVPAVRRCTRGWCVRRALPNMSASERAAIRRAASDNGIEVSGLHWLLIAPAGLSITTQASRERTEYLLKSGRSSLDSVLYTLVSLHVLHWYLLSPALTTPTRR